MKEFRDQPSSKATSYPEPHGGFRLKANEGLNPEKSSPPSMAWPLKLKIQNHLKSLPQVKYLNENLTKHVQDVHAKSCKRL